MADPHSGYSPPTTSGRTSARRSGYRALSPGLAAAVGAMVVLALAVWTQPVRVGAVGVVSTCDESAFDAALANGVVTLACDGTITFTTTKVIGRGQVVSVDGSNRQVSLSGGGNVSLFRVVQGGTLVLNRLTITGGPSGPTEYPYQRVAVFSQGSLQVADVVFRENLRGAIFVVGGQLSVTRSTFSNNRSSIGAAILGQANCCSSQTLIEIRDSTFEENQADKGGAIYISDSTVLTIISSTLHQNQASIFGGAIMAASMYFPEHDVTLFPLAKLINTTVSANKASSGGAFYGTGTDLLAVNNTFAQNSAVTGSSLVTNGSVVLTNNVIAEGLLGENCIAGPEGEFVNGGGNLADDSSCGFPAGPDPQLGSLTDNGGFTATMAIAPRSPAFDTGVRTACNAPLPAGAGTVDQRGSPRYTCSAGAFEPMPELSTRRFVPSVARQ